MLIVHKDWSCLSFFLLRPMGAFIKKILHINKRNMHIVNTGMYIALILTLIHVNTSSDAANLQKFESSLSS